MNSILFEKTNYYNTQNKRREFDGNIILYISLSVLSFVLGVFLIKYLRVDEFSFNEKSFDYMLQLVVALYFMLYIPTAYWFKIFLYSKSIITIKYRDDCLEIQTFFLHRKIENFELFLGAEMYAQNINFLWFRGNKYLEHEEPLFVNSGENYTIHDIDRNKYYLITLVKKERDESKS